MALASLLLALLAGCGPSGGAPDPDAGPLPVAQCTNATDLAIFVAVSAALDGGLPDGGVVDGGPYPPSLLLNLTPVLVDCASGPCLGLILAEGDAYQCMNDCLATTPAAGLSAGCIACQSESVRCGAASCAAECLGSDPALCVQCGYQHCGARSIACTGLPLDPP